MEGNFYHHSTDEPRTTAVAELLERSFWFLKGSAGGVRAGAPAGEAAVVAVVAPFVLFLEGLTGGEDEEESGRNKNRIIL